MKYSRQREAVREILMKHHDHPTADAVYAELKKTEPNISLATVYRNLNLLASMGEIRKLAFPFGADHFDGDLTEHYHFVCQKCGKVYDVPMEAASQLNAEAESLVPGRVTAHNLIFYGECNDCIRAEEQGSSGSGEKKAG